MISTAEGTARYAALAALDRERFPSLESSYLKVAERLKTSGFEPCKHPLPGGDGQLQPLERGRTQVCFLPFADQGETGSIRVDIHVAVLGKETTLFAVVGCGQAEFMSAREECFFAPGEEDGALEHILALARNAGYLAEDYPAISW